MNCKINLCTSVLRGCSCKQAIEIAGEAGFDGIELRVNDDGHASLDLLEQHGALLRERLDITGLSLPVLSSYIGIHDAPNVNRLLACAQRLAVPMVRLALPGAMSSAVARLSCEGEGIPSYRCSLRARDLIHSVRQRLSYLQSRAADSGVRILIELHWGTVMSSFTAAALLLDGIDPATIALTFDPANMIVEGREDWEFGLQLNTRHIANVHVKNAAWTAGAGMARWGWTAIADGMVDWRRMIGYLYEIGYSGDYSIEDFLTPRTSPAAAAAYLGEKRLEFLELLARASGWVSQPPALSSESLGAPLAAGPA
jgi:sugar phosphate isomerase/epimerase